MAILVPGAGFFNRGGLWEILPAPGSSLIGAPRAGTKLTIYENITPVVITAQGNLICPGGTPFSPVQPSPELITGIRIDPGTGAPNVGKGVTVLQSRGGVRDIPEMTCPVFKENIVYNQINSPPIPTLVLTPAITGFVSEKYLYDGDFGFSKLSKGETVPLTTDKLTGGTMIQGTGSVVSPGFKRNKKVTTRNLPGGTGAGNLNAYVPPAGAAVTVGSSAIEKAAGGSNYMWSMKPSLITVLRFFYVITVTSTCPPYTWTFPAYMDVENNWVAHSKRVQYRINRQVEAPEFRE